MAKSSPPRKRRQVRQVNVPMTDPAHRRIALEIRLAAETLILAPSTDAYNTLSKMLAALGSAGLACDALDQANDTMGEIVDRYERVGKVGVKDCEAAALRQAIAKIDGRMALIQVNKFSEAVAKVEVFCATVGA